MVMLLILPTLFVKGCNDDEWWTYPSGEKGDKGDNGLNGLDGKDGLNGLDGKDGKGWINSEDGLSIYEIAIIKGFKGTETEWFNLTVNTIMNEEKLEPDYTIMYILFILTNLLWAFFFCVHLEVYHKEKK
jgi:hypothetical protein